MMHIGQVLICLRGDASPAPRPATSLAGMPQVRPSKVLGGSRTHAIFSTASRRQPMDGRREDPEQARESDAG